MSTRHVGIRDVAEAAGVSVTTVSHVLNNTPHTRTSEETKERVRAAAKELGYGPNRLARALRTQRSGLIGLLSEEIDPVRRAHMGNTPQALSHLSLVRAADAIVRASDPDEARDVVTAVRGW